MRGGLAASLSLALVLLPGCERTPRADRPSVLLISIDTLRADRCSAYGYERETTPHLQRLAEDGARFAVAYAPTATTAPSHATLFTGLYPLAHGVLKNGVPLAERHRTLAEVARRVGYQTAAVVGSYPLKEHFGFAQGFQRFDDDFSGVGATYRPSRWAGRPVQGAFDRRAEETTRRAIEWLQQERRSETPFLLFVHYFDPHDPYDPPSEHLERLGLDPALEQDRYDAEIAFTDAEIGRLLAGLDALGLGNDTLILVTADHGEGLMDHGYPHHGVQLYEESVRVPWLVRWPGRIAPGGVISEPVALVDLLPTLLGLLRIPASGPMPGRDLSTALLAGHSLDPDHPVWLYRRPYDARTLFGVAVQGERFAVRVGPWKLLAASEEGGAELYDLAADPRERHDQAALRPEKVIELEALVSALRERYGAEREPVEPVSPADLEALRALGYVE